jgi:hypothetical protein
MSATGILFFAQLIQAMLAARDSLRIAIQVMLALEAVLDNKLNYLLALYTHMQDMEAHIKSVVDSTDEVTLNMRGTLFVIEAAHLTASSNIFFHTLIYSDPAPIRGHFFIDRPFEGFDRIISTIRGNDMSYEGLSGYEEQCLDENLEYFCLPFLRYNRVFQASNKRATQPKKISCFQSISDGRLCIGLENGVIQVSSTLTFDCEMELLGHTESVRFVLQLSDGRLCSAAGDYAIKLWNLSAGQCVMTLEGTSCITALVQFSATRVLCASWDNKMRLWDIESGICEKTIQVKQDQLNLQRIPNGFLASLGYAWSHNGFDLVINVWDIEAATNTRVMTIELGREISFPQAMIQLGSGDLCVCLNSGISIYDYQTGVKIKTIALPSYADRINAVTLLQNQRLCISTHKSQSHICNLVVLNLESEEYEQNIKLDRAHLHRMEVMPGTKST